MHPPMHSLHEAYAVISEEIDELWDEVRKKERNRDPANIRKELIQIAASAWRASRDLGYENADTVVDVPELASVR